MAIFSMKDLEQMSGIKAHTLRVWEKRYGIIKPRRTDTNIRYFEDDDLQKILSIALLRKQGMKISEIAALSDDELKQAVAKCACVDHSHIDKMDGLVLAMMELDDVKFDKILSCNVSEKGFEGTMSDIIYPFMDKLSGLWMSGNIRKTHENFAAAHIKRKLILAIESLDIEPCLNSAKFLLFLPEGEIQELSILYLHYMLKKMGIQVIYLGSQIQIEDAIEAQKITHAEFVFTLFNEVIIGTSLQDFADDFSKKLKNSTLIISGYQTLVQNIQVPENVIVLSSMDAVRMYAENLVKHKE